MTLAFTVLAFSAFISLRAEAQTTGIIFHVYDESGNPVRWGDFRRREENGTGDDGANDAILNPADLTVILKGDDEAYGLYSTEDGTRNENRGDPMIDWPGGGPWNSVSLGLAWPTAAGYSNLILDLPDPSTGPKYPSSQIPVYTAAGGRTYSVIFNLLAAQQVMGSLDRALALRAAAPFSYPYTPSSSVAADYTSAYNSAKDDLRRALGEGIPEKQRGKLGQKALEEAAAATLLMMEDYGIQYAHAHRPAFAPTWGVTFEGEIQQPGGHPAPINEAAFDSVRRLVDCSASDGWVRLVLDRTKSPDYYKPAIRWAHANGLRVVGEILDSFDMCCTTKEQWEAHVSTYVGALYNHGSHPEEEVDEWEVGNEVNGEWLHEKSKEERRCDRCTGYAAGADYIAYAAEYVKLHTDKRTLLTLFWQVGEDKPSSSMFNWVRDRLLPTRTPSGRGVSEVIDDIGISLYPDKAPMGLAFDRVFSTLNGKYFAGAGQRIMITELDYWPARDTEPGYTHTWRWGAKDLNQEGDERVRQGVRAQVAKLYQSAALGYPYSGGGTFWWYYLKEAAPNADYPTNRIWAALHGTHSTVAGPGAVCPSVRH
jgi:hypothetical protein